MTRYELIEKLINQLAHIPGKIIEAGVREMLDYIAISLTKGERVEICGFGSFSLHYRAPRIGRNPKTGNKVNLKEKHVPHFKPGKELRNRVNI
ncbi:Integration host factor subunit beta [Arsenophonus endosymbiont of Aleurodicus dispersus]|uniref:integration host factor subunit beta n=1 Tax=Arsenophonus endosymbiont of Aleurodicus dispersus TaxID=235559 RepID=UPI000EB57BC4|nr:integration host factor subunit beta [Arsenophonus endosymbiont of Aleurodicus dispersus]VAY02331.1 Integration host factor subunit beta [Arsenophonus endosymbiont of Aleurodicus dispersus]